MKLLLILLTLVLTACGQTGVYNPMYSCPIIISQSAFDSILARTEIIRSTNQAKDCKSIGIKKASLALGCIASNNNSYKMVVPSHLGEKAERDTIVHEVCHIVRGDNNNSHDGWILR